MSNPLDEAKRQQIVDTCEEVCKVFSTEFAKGYKNALIASCKADAEDKYSGGSPEFQLLPAPPDATVVKAGWLTKRGDVRKNWKRRYFVALNAKDNFDILYYEAEQKLDHFNVSATRYALPLD